MSEQNNSPLHKLADTLAGPRPQPKPEPVDHVRAAVESFVAQKAHIEKLEARLHDQEITIARMDVELETRICDLNEARRERDHYFEYATRLVTQLNAADQLIRDALDMAKEKRIEPSRHNPYPATDRISITDNAQGSGATADVSVDGQGAISSIKIISPGPLPPIGAAEDPHHPV